MTSTLSGVIAHHHQKLVLSQWMGCARLIWNARREEHCCYCACARKYYPVGTFRRLITESSSVQKQRVHALAFRLPGPQSSSDGIVEQYLNCSECVGQSVLTSMGCAPELGVAVITSYHM